MFFVWNINEASTRMLARALGIPKRAVNVRMRVRPENVRFSAQ